MNIKRGFDRVALVAGCIIGIPFIIGSVCVGFTEGIDTAQFFIIIFSPLAFLIPWGAFKTLSWLILGFMKDQSKEN